MQEARWLLYVSQPQLVDVVSTVNNLGMDSGSIVKCAGPTQIYARSFHAQRSCRRVIRYVSEEFP